ncbi:MAG TPA: iron ABC transporter permease [Phycisphaerae bacterium]|nr:iron ABC transporter permease [Phycisphaerae bacterium]
MRIHKQQVPAYVVAAVVFALLAMFLLWPIAATLQAGFFVDGEFTVRHIVNTFQHPLYRAGLINSLMIAVATTLASILLGVPLALVANRYRFAGKRIWSGLILVPMILPPFVGAIGLKNLLDLRGSVNMLLRSIGVLGSGPNDYIDWLGQSGFWGVVIMETLHLYPIMFLNVQAALANVDPSLEEASRNLGAGGWRTFRRVTLPLARPGLFAGATIVFIWSFTELGTPLMLSYNEVTSVQIFDFFRVESARIHPQAFALVVVLLTFSAALYLIGRVLLGRGTTAMLTKATRGAVERSLGAVGTILATLLFGVTTLLAVLPHIGVVLDSVAGVWTGTVLPTEYTGDHYVNAMDPEYAALPSIVNSLKYSVVATGLDVVVGLAIGYLVVRTRIRGRQVLDTLAMLPLAVPGLVMAAGYIAITRAGTMLEAIGPWKDPTILLIIAYAVRRLPYLVRSVVAGLQQTSVELEEAARNLGASPLRTIRKVTLPLIAANLIAGSLLTFSFAMLEVSDSLMLAGDQAYYPITKAIYGMMSIADTVGIATSMGVMGMLLLTGTILAASLLIGRRLGAIFRV